MVIFHLLGLADVAHFGSTTANHLVASLFLEKLKIKRVSQGKQIKHLAASRIFYLLLALPALSDHRLGELLFDRLPGALTLLHLITPQWHMIALFAYSAAFSSTVWIPAHQHLVLRVLHHGAIMAEGAFDESFQSSPRNFLCLAAL